MPNPASRPRTFVYVDGLNLYHGLRDAGLRRLYWLDIQRMAVRLVGKNRLLAMTKYFTARIRSQQDGDTPERAAERLASYERQKIYLDALAALRHFEIIEGNFLIKRTHCRHCKRDFYRPEEKETDVRIATELLTDAFLDRFDIALLVSGDSDLCPPLRAIKVHHPRKELIVVFPPKRVSRELAFVAGSHRHLYVNTLAKCQLPDQVLNRRGVALNRPLEWI